MKHWIIVCLAVFAPLTLISNHEIQRVDVTFSTASASDSKPDVLLGVDQLMKNVDQYKGTIRVEGVVSFVSPQTEMLALIDSKEYVKCGVVTCSILTLPVHWKGAMPSVRHTVRVKGTVKERKGKLILEALELEDTAPQQERTP